MAEINKKIKDIRLLRGLTLDDLAARTGFTKGYLSKVERAENPPPFATTQLIADALQIDLAELVEGHPESRGSKNIDLLRSRSDDWDSSSSVYSFQPLVNSYKNKYMSPFLFRVATGETEITTHDSEEFVHVLEGSVELQYEGKTFILQKGDSFYLDARIKHNFVNRSDKAALCLAVHYNYRRF